MSVLEKEPKRLIGKVFERLMNKECSIGDKVRLIEITGTVSVKLANY